MSSLAAPGLLCDKSTMSYGFTQKLGSFCSAELPEISSKEVGEFRCKPQRYLGKHQHFVSGNFYLISFVISLFSGQLLVALLSLTVFYKSETM